MSSNGLSEPDLTSCDREPITRLNQIQSFGFLLAMSKDWNITRASANLEAFLGIEPHAALGASLDSLLNDQALHDIRNRMTLLRSTKGVERLYGVTLVVGRPPLDISVHYADSSIVLEGELSHLDDREDAASLVRVMMARLSAHITFDAFHNDVARQIRSMTGFDRVMVYRFDETGAGEVIAEAVSSGIDSFLGLHFPASDIPVQARALYVRNTFRLIADVSARSVPLLAPSPGAAEPLDLSLSFTRAVSPVHLEYLRNMDVAASLSISVIVDGQLWGLIACHNRTPRLPSFVTRTAAELFGQMYSMTLESRLRQADNESDRHVDDLIDRIVAAIAENESLLANAEYLRGIMNTLIPCDGVAISLRGAITTGGATPSIPDIAALIDRLKAAPANRIVSTDHVASLRPEASAHATIAAGLLAIPISRVPRDYILLFRRERTYGVTWAGNPDKPVLTTDCDVRLSPRKSFEAFSKTTQGHSLPFLERERRGAKALRSELIDVILHFSESSEDQGQRASQRQELLIAELNHRVRNILSLIRGLVSQTEDAETNLATYVQSLNGRIQALARAHDQITRQNWGPGQLVRLLEEGIIAYIPARKSRFSIQGPGVLLHPEAFSTFSLVAHELVTNCAKYGSLSTDGSVTVTFDRRLGDGLYLAWRETGGPTVLPPRRRGFGSVIIERVVPFDLNGRADIRYCALGLEADFFIPEQHLAAEECATSERRGVASDLTEPVADDPNVTRPLEGKTVLLLEDNMIVALEAEDLLSGLGAATVFTAASISHAMQIVKSEHLDFAVLDVNVGKETSIEFARSIRDAGIPFIFASGYGEALNVATELASIVTISKPYGMAALAATVTRALALSPGSKTASFGG